MFWNLQTSGEFGSFISEGHVYLLLSNAACTPEAENKGGWLETSIAPSVPKFITGSIIRGDEALGTQSD